MIIRKAKIEEVALIQRLNYECFYENKSFDTDFVENWSFIEEAKKYYTDAISGKESIILVAELDKKLIGYISGCPKKYPYRISKYFEIENLGVLPEYKGKEVAKRLYEDLCALVAKDGYRKIQLGVYIKNKRAIAFYKKLGFAEIDLGLEIDL